MKLSEWLKELNYEWIQGSLDVEVEDVIYDSRKARARMVFVCMKGTRVDSHDFIADVVNLGVSVLVVEKEVELPEGVTAVRVADAREALALLSAARFGYPARRMVTIGVTGTKGKTTTTHMIKAILEAAGKKVGMIGTTGIVIGEETTPTKNTTPESYELQAAFDHMARSGCEYMIMEVSSQGLKMHRVDGIYFDYALFTNISPDHIGPDEHADFEEYLYYKSRIFSSCRVGLMNADDEHFEAVVKDRGCEEFYTFSCAGSQSVSVRGAQTEGEAQADTAPAGMARELSGSSVCAAGCPQGDTFGLERSVDYRADHIRYVSEPGFVGVEFDVHGRREMDVRLGIPGLFNVYNALGAVCVCSLLGIPEDSICHGLEHVRVNGRMEIVHTSPRCTVIVDYAHNAVSMESLLTTLREYHPERLVCVFGCGGNRSKERRYSMGEIGGRLADLSILTADNSRYEKVEDILADIRGSIEKTGGSFIEIPDRREAITYSITHAREGDMIAIIGKGHEDYQEIEGVRYPFLDRAVAEEVVAGLEQGGKQRS